MVTDLYERNVSNEKISASCCIYNAFEDQRGGTLFKYYNHVHLCVTNNIIIVHQLIL